MDGSRAREGYERTCTTLLVFSLLLAKGLAQLAPVTVMALDTGLNFFLYAIFSPYPPGEKLRRSYENYTFRRSLFDLLIVSTARAVALCVAYLVCTIRRSSSAYLYATILISVLSLGFLTTKAALYDFAVDRKVYSNFVMFGPMMLTLNLSFVFVVRESRAPARPTHPRPDC